MNPRSWQEAQRILAVRLDAFGDLLMTTPAIRALREESEGRSVTLLTSPAGAAIARLVPEIDEIIVYDSPWMKATAPRASGADHEMIARLRTGNFDAAAIFTVYSQNPLPAALLCHLADIPLRLAHCRENPYQLLTHWLPEREPGQIVRHEVQRQLDLVAAVGCRAGNRRLSLRPPVTARQAVRRLLRREGVKPGRFIVMHPGASAPSRRYPAAQFAAAARLIARRFDWPVLLTGSPAEEPLVREIQHRIDGDARALAGRLTLAELVALIEASPLLVSNNTGPVHVAAAVGTPVVDLYALTNPQHTPWMVPSRVLFHDVPCRYCYKSVCPEGHHDCLRRVDPSAILEAAVELIEGRDRAARTTMPAIGPVHGTAKARPATPGLGLIEEGGLA